MLERASFLTTLQQTFAIPENANELSFDLLFAPGFDLDDGFFPDAFEAQLLDEDSIPVVEPWDKRATSYFNVQEDLTTFVSPQAAYEPIIGEDGAPGYHVKLDISQVPAGIMVTLYFDLIGADADIGSGVSIDNVAVTQAGCPPDDLPCEFVVVLDADSQGEICAETVRPTINGIDCLAPMTVTARTRISGLTPKDPQADGSPGSVIITDFGAGVAPATCDGDDFISGVGPDQDEELIFEFDSSVNLKDITIRLRDIDFIFDQPVLFISDLSTPGYEYVMLEPAIQSAFTLMDFREGLILFSRFQDLPSRMVVDKFKIRETRDGFTVDLVRAIRTGCVGP